MLKLTLKPGEYINIGNDVRVIFSGGSSNNIHLLIEAPKEIPVVRSSAGKKNNSKYYAEAKISDEAQREIVGILMREKKKNENKISQ